VKIFSGPEIIDFRLIVHSESWRANGRETRATGAVSKTLRPNLVVTYEAKWITVVRRSVFSHIGRRIPPRLRFNTKYRCMCDDDDDISVWKMRFRHYSRSIGRSTPTENRSATFRIGNESRNRTSREENEKEEPERMYAIYPPCTLHIPSDFLCKYMFFRTILFEENNDDSGSDEERSTYEEIEWQTRVFRSFVRVQVIDKYRKYVY